MKNQQGQTIIEIMIAMGALVLLLSAITIITITSLSGANYSRDQSNATEYAQQGMEVLRQLRDADYGTFSSLNGLYCLASTCTTWASCNPQPATSCAPNITNYFSRSVTITPKAANPPDCQSQGKSSTEVVVKVAWSDGKCKGATTFCENVTVNSCLSDNNLPQKP